MTTAAEVKNHLLPANYQSSSLVPVDDESGHRELRWLSNWPGPGSTGMLKRISRRWPKPPALYNIAILASLKKSGRLNQEDKFSKEPGNQNGQSIQWLKKGPGRQSATANCLGQFVE